MLKNKGLWGLIAIFFLAAIVLLTAPLLLRPPNTTASTKPWEEQWGVLPGLAVIAEAPRFRFPTNIVAIPDPGHGPDDPHLLVLELEGRLLAVSREGNITPLVEGFVNRPGFDNAGLNDEYGAVGLCLAPKQGYIFVTYASFNEAGLLENVVLRIQATPDTFNAVAGDYQKIPIPFTTGSATPNHQIGSCVVAGDILFLSIGDGLQAGLASNPSSNLGKVLALTLDGEPYPANPFYANQVAGNSANSPYVWASGFRNPFGLINAQDRLFVADNGLDLDRFLEITAGSDYGWSGTDQSLGVEANAIFYPAIAPTNIAYIPLGYSGLPVDYGNSFIIGSFGNLTGSPALANRHYPGLMQVNFDFQSGQVSDTPRFILRYQQNSPQGIVAVTAAPEGVYFSPFLPDDGEFSRLYRIAVDTNSSYPSLIDLPKDAEHILNQSGCFGCHMLGERGRNIGPPLDARALRSRLMERLNSDEYLESLIALDTLETPPLPDYQAQRANLLEADPETRVRLWLQYRLEQPRFDNLHAVMPEPDLNAEQIAILVDYLLTPPSITTEIKQAFIRQFPVLQHRMLFYSFAIGVFVGVILFQGFNTLGTALRNRLGKR